MGEEEYVHINLKILKATRDKFYGICKKDYRKPTLVLKRVMESIVEDPSKLERIINVIKK